MDELAVGQMSLDGMDYTIESVVRSKNNGPLIAAAAKLWVKEDDTVLDATYGRGRFWTTYRPRTLIAHDLAHDGVDFRDLPEADGSVDIVVLDPPYINQGNTEKSTLPDEFQDRYGLVDGPRTVPELLSLYEDGFREAQRVLRHKGRLLVKCMDFAQHSRYQAIHPWLVQTAEEMGYRIVDTFIHYSGVGATSPGQVQTQRTSRRAHSVLLVFQKWE